MPKTYIDESEKTKVVEPMFSRDRQTYRGNRSSARENLEINSLIVDFNRLSNRCTDTENELLAVCNNLVFNVYNLTEEENKNDGKNYAIEDVISAVDDRSGAYGDTEEPMSLETITKLTGKIQRIKNKLIRLENNI